MPSTMSRSLRRLFSCLSARCHGDAGTSSTAPMPAATGSAGGSEDLTIRLPNDVLSTIISLLPTKDAARTALLSSQWRGLWESTPLVLDDSDLLLGGNFTGVSTVTATVSRAINHHPGPFHSVNLTCYFADDEGDILTGWIRALATKGVHKLVLANIPWAGLDVLPCALLRCRSLERLHLSAWRFPDTASVIHGVAFPRLREFVLSKSIIREQDLETMLACSPALKSVVFFLSCGVPAQVHLRSRSLQCIVFWQSMADELAVVAAPLLQRVILWSSSCSCRSNYHRMRIKISRASVLQVVGYLNPSFHQLQIGDTVIKAGIKASPEVAVPSVKILALSIRFGVAGEARMVPCFLRCFPNTETLHLMSVQDHRPTNTEHSNVEFWKEIDSIQCVKSSIKKIVLHEFRWENSEIEFLTSIMERGQVLEKIYIFQAQYGSVEEGEINGKLSLLASLNWGGALMILSGQSIVSRYDIATDLSRSDPFDCQS